MSQVETETEVSISERALRLARAYPWRVRTDGIVVLPEPTKSVTAGGIHIANADSRPSLTGYVVATGPDTKDVKVGDKIFFAQYSGQNLDAGHGEEKCVLLRLEHVRMVAK